jgi:hypothetical protein
MARPSPRCDWLAIWILWSAWCSLTGWTLSALHLLDRAGYIVTTLLFAGLLVACRRWLLVPGTRPPWLWRRSTYARHLLPKIWLAGAVMVVIGGLVYRPTDYDYLTYRFPRLLHWWWAQHWTWIDTTDERQNTSAPGMEWLMAPSLALFRTDRLFSLINILSFLFLPGLIFAVFRQMGAAGRMTWNWMWLLPFGYCFALQAGSAGNDVFAAVPFLASLYYAARARPGAPWAAALSILAIALVTGDKASNIPLGLPWLAVVWLNRKTFLGSTRPAVLAAACAVGLVCSFVPVGLLNFLHTGSYTGDPLNTFRLQVKSPAAGIVGNSLEILSSALPPPFWPHALVFPLLSDAQVAAVKQGFPRFSGLGNLAFQLEDNAGVGLGVTVLVVATFLAGLVARLRGHAPRLRRGAWLFALASAAALGAYMMKMGSEAAGRLIAAYYLALLLSLLLLLPESGAWPRSLAWRALTALVMLVVLQLLALNPARPMLPPPLLTPMLRIAHAPASAITQLEANHQLRFARLDLFRTLRLAIPASEKELDVVETLDDPETPWWIPLGSREVVRAHPEQPGSLGKHYVAVNLNYLQNHDHLTLAQLLQQNSLRVVQQQVVVSKTLNPPATWCLLAPATSSESAR